jgi:hypothetical protein
MVSWLGCWAAIYTAPYPKETNMLRNIKRFADLDEYFVYF